MTETKKSDLPGELAAPAQRALAGARIHNLNQLSKFTETEIKQMHGIGPNALKQLRGALDNRGLSFASEKGDLPTNIGNPARNALANVGIQTLRQLTKFTETEIKQLHGVGPNALGKLRIALESKGLSFATKKKNKA
jgi:DNA-directed RNA polymerase alpha subunit